MRTKVKSENEFVRSSRSDELLDPFKTMFFCAEHIGLAALSGNDAKLSQTYPTGSICSALFLIYTSFALISTASNWKWSNESIDGIIIAVGNALLFATCSLWIVVTSLGKIIYGNIIPLWFRKLVFIEKKLRSLSSADEDYRKLKILVNILVVLAFVIEFGTSITFSIGMYHVTGEINITSNAAFTLPLLCVFVHSAHYICTMYTLLTRLTLANFQTNYFLSKLNSYRKSKPEMCRKWWRKVIGLLEIQDSLCDLKNKYLNITRVLNISFLLAVTSLTIFNTFDIVNQIIKSNLFGAVSISLFLWNLYAEFIFYVMAYTTVRFSLEVIINCILFIKI